MISWSVKGRGRGACRRLLAHPGQSVRETWGWSPRQGQGSEEEAAVWVSWADSPLSGKRGGLRTSRGGARVVKQFRGELTGEGARRWRQGDPGETSALGSRELGGVRTTPVTLQVADVKQFDCPHFFCEDVSPLRSTRDLQLGRAAAAAGRSLGVSRETGAGGLRLAGSTDPGAEESRDLRTDGGRRARVVSVWAADKERRWKLGSPCPKVTFVDDVLSTVRLAGQMKSTIRHGRRNTSDRS